MLHDISAADTIDENRYRDATYDTMDGCGISLSRAESTSNTHDATALPGTSLGTPDGIVPMRPTQPTSQPPNRLMFPGTDEGHARRALIASINEESELFFDLDLDTIPIRRCTFEAQSRHRNTAYSTEETGLQDEGQFSMAFYGLDSKAIDDEFSQEDLVTGELKLNPDGSLTIIPNWIAWVLCLLSSMHQ